MLRPPQAAEAMSSLRSFTYLRAVASPCACDLAVLVSSTAWLSLLLDSPKGLLLPHGMLGPQCFPAATPSPSTGQPSALHTGPGLPALHVEMFISNLQSISVCLCTAL